MEHPGWYNKEQPGELKECTWFCVVPYILRKRGASLGLFLKADPLPWGEEKIRGFKESPPPPP